MRLVFCALAAVLLLAGCGPAEQDLSDLAGRQIRVVSTVGMLKDVVANVGGERVEASALMGPGTDPHLYRPTAGDVSRLERADLVLYGGLELEGRMSDILGKLSQRGTPTVAIGEQVPETELREAPGFKGRYDPHIWFDVSVWKHAVEAVRDELVKLDPGSKDLYQRNAAAYLNELDALDKEVQTKVASLPENQRVLVTAHDAFGYFGDRYGMEVIGIQGTSTATEAAAGKIRDLAELITKRKVKAIFVESSVPRATVEALQEAVRARGWNVRIGGQLFSDAMGAEGTPEGTYVGMVRHNVDTIVGALK